MAPAHFLYIYIGNKRLKILARALAVIDLIDIYCPEALLQSPNNRIDGKMLIIYTTTTTSYLYTARLSRCGETRQRLIIGRSGKRIFPQQKEREYVKAITFSLSSCRVRVGCVSAS